MSENRRNTRRWPELTAPEGNLKWSGGQTAVRVIDQSCEGLGLELPASRRLQAGDHVWLRTASGVTEGIVMHVEEAGAACHVGMARVRDFAPDDIPKWRWRLGLGPQPKAGDWRPQGTRAPSLAVWGLFTLFAVGIVGFALYREPTAWSKVKTLLGLGAARTAAVPALHSPS